MTDTDNTCFWCASEAQHYHPTCGAWNCEADVHGFGPGGKRVTSHCSDCRGEE